MDRSGGSSVARRRRARRLARMVREVGRCARSVGAAGETWIGLASSPPARVVAASGWRPDAREAYCPRCGGSVGPGEVTAEGCAACRLGGAIAHRVVRLGAYAGPLRRWVLEVKFGGAFELGTHLGERLGEAVRASGALGGVTPVIVPMPMPVTRRLYRGIDHARVIASGVARSLDARVARPLARRGGAPQATLPPGERRRRGARGLRRRRPVLWTWAWGSGLWSAAGAGGGLTGRPVVLVDDVLTTGASVRAALRLLGTLRPSRLVVAVVGVSDPRTRLRRLLEDEIGPREGPGAPLLQLSQIHGRSR